MLKLTFIHSVNQQAITISIWILEDFSFRILQFFWDGLWNSVWSIPKMNLFLSPSSNVFVQENFFHNHLSKDESPILTIPSIYNLRIIINSCRFIQKYRQDQCNKKRCCTILFWVRTGNFTKWSYNKQPWKTISSLLYSFHDLPLCSHGK